jgi:hypothetical protein
VFKRLRIAYPPEIMLHVKAARLRSPSSTRAAKGSVRKISRLAPARSVSVRPSAERASSLCRCGVRRVRSKRAWAASESGPRHRDFSHPSDVTLADHRHHDLSGKSSIQAAKWNPGVTNPCVPVADDLPNDKKVVQTVAERPCSR